MKQYFFAIAGIMIAGLMMTGCTPSDRASVGRLFGQAGPISPLPSRMPLVYRGPIYCYDTLANPDCFAEPFPRMDERFVGAYIETSDYPDSQSGSNGQGKSVSDGPNSPGNTPGPSANGGARF
jgi:hypothetical protein